MSISKPCLLKVSVSLPDQILLNGQDINDADFISTTPVMTDTGSVKRINVAQCSLPTRYYFTTRESTTDIAPFLSASPLLRIMLLVYSSSTFSPGAEAAPMMLSDVVRLTLVVTFSVSIETTSATVVLVA
jgi:hypothetical protein